MSYCCRMRFEDMYILIKSCALSCDLCAQIVSNKQDSVKKGTLRHARLRRAKKR